MARSYAAIYSRIWADQDWRALDVNAQHLYLLLISQPSMNLAGVLPLQLRKWAACVDGWDMADVADALDRLCDSRFVVVDEDTEEVLIRTFIRNDGNYKIPNVLKSLLQVAEGTQAPALRSELAVELGRLDPLDGKKADEAAGWIAATRLVLGASDGPSGPGGEPLPEPLPEGLGEGFVVTVPGTLNGTVKQPLPEPLPQPSGSGSGSGTSLSLVDYRGGESAPPPPNPPQCKRHADLDPDDVPACRACGRLREQWETARVEAAKPKPPPPLCGQCENRWVETDRGMAHCPRCHPNARRAS
jgi:hypothetical protein